MSGFSRVAALTAANLTSNATTELLRFASDGNGLPNHPFGTQDPTVELAKALIASAGIERDGIETAHGTEGATEVTALTELIAACRKFVDDWGGNADPVHLAEDNAVGSVLPPGIKVVFPNPYRPLHRSRGEQR